MNTQKEAVFQAVTSFYGSKFSNGQSHTAEDKKKIVDALIEAQANGEFEVKSAQKDMRVYIVGLLNNHLRKDTRLNGGEKYTPANPGSRAGTSDPQIKAMRQLLKKFEEGSTEAAEIQGRIDAAVAAIKAEKATAQIDVENLPEELRRLV